jgi:hypothetical protein
VYRDQMAVCGDVVVVGRRSSVVVVVVLEF